MNKPVFEPPTHQIATRLKRMHESGDKSFSVELCAKQSMDLTELHKIHVFNPSFYSIIWREDGNARANLAVSLAAKLSKFGALLHLACRYLDKETVRDILLDCVSKGVTNIFALHGETLPMQSQFDFTHAVDLVKFIRESFGGKFSIGVTGYPETHSSALSPEDDLRRLKEKVDAGSDFVITQAVFDTVTFHRFYKNCRDMGIKVPIVPGVFVVKSYTSLQSLAKFCKLQICERTLRILQSIKDNELAMQKFGVDYCVSTVKTILCDKTYPVCNFHIFSLNNFESVRDVCEQLGFGDCHVERPIALDVEFE